MNKKFSDFICTQINQIRTDGLTVLLRKGYTIFLIILAVPIVILVRVLRPLLLIRIGRLESRRIGLFLANTEIYLCERDAGMHPRRTFDIFYHYLPISNFQVKKMWERTRRLYISPFSRLTQIVDRLNSLLPGARRHTISIISKTDTYGLRPGAKVYLSFTAQEEHLGHEALQKLGVSDSASFVCFHARDSAYLDTMYPDYNWRYQDHRDTSIRHYLPAVQELTQRGHFAVRMGAVVKEALNINNSRIIDYAFKGRTEFLDVYLGAKCRFFICDTAGISSIPLVFKRPIVWVNYIQLAYLPSSGVQDLIIPMKFWLRKEQRFLTLREILNLGIGAFSRTEQFANLGVECRENTPEEIKALAIEMDERLKGTWQTTPEDEELQKRLWALLKPNNLHQVETLRFGTEFLRQNRNLLE